MIEKKQFDYYFEEHKMPYRDIDPSRLALGLIKQNSKVLSCGCGSGREVSFLRSIGCEVKAIDYSKRMIEQSKKQEPEADYFISELTRLNDINLAENQFDYITCLFNTINNLNLNDKRGFIIKCYSLLKPQGKLIITTTNRLSSLRVFLVGLFNIHNQKSYYYPPSEVKIWFRDVPYHVRRTKINNTNLIVAEK